MKKVQNANTLEHVREWNAANKLLQFAGQFQSRSNWKNLCLLPDFCCFNNWEFFSRSSCLQEERYEKNNQRFYREHGDFRLHLSSFCVLSYSHAVVRGPLAYRWFSWGDYMQGGLFIKICICLCLYIEPGFDSS